MCTTPYCDSLFTKFINLWLLTIFTVNFFHPSSSCKTVENEEPFFPSLSPHSRTDCCGGKKEPHRRLRWIKYCPAGVCYQGTAFQSFSVCHKNCPQYFPFVPPRLPISLAPALGSNSAMYCTRKLGIFFAYCEHHAMFWCSYYAGFIKAFSNEPLHWPISDQSVVRGLSVGASLPLFPALVSRTWLAQTYIKWVQYGRAGCIWGQSVGGKTIKPVGARGNLH